MNIHEHQAKEILRQYNVPTPFGLVAFTAAEIENVAKDLAARNPGGVLVVKAQIHAGGRGKAGGVKVVKSMDEAISAGKNMLGKVLVTHQTGPEGKLVQRVYIEEGSNIKKEYYLSLVMDRQSSRITFIASAEGGMDIEEVAEHSPEKIVKVTVDPATDIQDFHVRKMAYGIGLHGEQVKHFAKVSKALYKAFVETDASQVEINPLIETKEGAFMALDAKFNFDDNGLFRHPDIMEMRDESEEEPLEIEASKFNLNYIKMDGTIGCMVNGAGLAMATMDIIKLYGAEPANFLDVGGGATTERVAEAFRIILSDSNVKGILINIFGGIMRCDVIAQGVVDAAKQRQLNVPVVVRLEGTNAALGKQILEKSGLALIPADDLADAAKKITQQIKSQ
ncbi:MAG: ADP-forming succinate--CoA ligase subunit beta [Proteobacteria bacterium]|nr:ADP-forming succinate--CoA ligase subunit beta [Pseudomonadota bacterium]